MKPERRVGRAIAIHACGTISVGLLTRCARCARLVVIAYDVRRRTLLALTRDAVLRANARLARGAVGVGTLARTTSDASRRTITVDVGHLWGLARLARWCAGTSKSSSRACRALGVVQATGCACLARNAKESLVVREGGCTFGADSTGRALLAHCH